MTNDNGNGKRPIEISLGEDWQDARANFEAGFEDAADGNAHEFGTEGDEAFTWDRNGDFAAQGPRNTDEDDIGLSTEERLKRRIWELGDQAEQARQHAKKLEEEQKDYIDLRMQDWILDGTYQFGFVPFFNNIKARDGNIKTSENLAKRATSEKEDKHKREKLAAMIKCYVNNQASIPASNDKANVLHAVLMKRNALLERGDGDPVKGKKTWLPDPQKSMLLGSMQSADDNLLARANTIASHLYEKGEIKRPIQFHATNESLANALEQKKANLKEEYKAQTGKDPEELEKQAKQYDQERNNLEELLGNESDKQAGTDAASGNQRGKQRQKYPDYAAIMRLQGPGPQAGR